MVIILFGVSVAQAQQAEKVSVIVGFKQSANPELINMVGGKNKSILKNMPIIIAEVPRTALLVLQKNNKVDFVEEDGIWSATGQVVPWGVDHIEADLAQNTGITGNGIKVGVLDSGVSQHVDIKVAGGWNYITNTSNYEDDYGHGTHVAGTIAALNNSLGSWNCPGGSAICFKGS